MASTDPEIRDNFTLPVWMKSRPTKDFEPFAASPPPPEDSFFYIKYPNTEMLIPKKSTLEQDIQNALQEPKVAAAPYGLKDKDWSKHTKPCQDVLHSIASVPNFATLNANGAKTKSAPDDEFKEDASACGTSVVKVATKMMSRSPRGFAIASPSDDADEIAAQSYHRGRRGSRSLPASPAPSPPSSPRASRRPANRYFTSPFERVGGGWVSAALLACKREFTASTSTLAEEDAINTRLQGTLAESVENLGPSPRPKEVKAPSEPPTEPLPSRPAKAAFRPKPTELREMNFWSPTSM